jgi:hypothetical protein
MAANRFHSRDRSKKRWPECNPQGEIQYLLRAEEQLLQLICSGVPLSEVLRKICNALDLELGNMISLVSLANGSATGLDAIAKSAELFGLHKFCSASVVAGDDELLGSLEMYCCAPRRPFLREVKLIERATCLAAIAITRHNEPSDYADPCVSPESADSGKIHRPRRLVN